jgi:hypothetical protein
VYHFKVDASADICSTWCVHRIVFRRLAMGVVPILLLVCFWGCVHSIYEHIGWVLIHTYTHLCILLLGTYACRCCSLPGCGNNSNAQLRGQVGMDFDRGGGGRRVSAIPAAS